MTYLNPGLNEGEFVAVIHELRELLPMAQWELFEVYVSDTQWNSLADGLYDGINNRTRGRYIIRYIPMVPVKEIVEVEDQPEPIIDPEPWAEYYTSKEDKSMTIKVEYTYTDDSTQVTEFENSKDRHYYEDSRGDIVSQKEIS